MGGFLTSLVIIDKFDQGGKKEKWKNFSGGEHQISGWKPADNAVSQKKFVLSIVFQVLVELKARSLSV